MSFEQERIQFMRFAMCNKNASLSSDESHSTRRGSAELCRTRDVQRNLSRVYWGGEGDAVTKIVIYNIISGNKNGPEFGLALNLVQSYNYNGIRGGRGNELLSSCTLTIYQLLLALEQHISCFLVILRYRGISMEMQPILNAYLCSMLQYLRP